MFSWHSVFTMFSDFCTASQPFFYFYSLKRGTKWRKFWVQHIQFKWFLLKLESIIMFLTRGLFFTFVMVIFTRLFRRGSTLCKSTLKMTTLFRSCLTLLNVVSTLFNIVNSNFGSYNVVLTLVWCCLTSRRHINLRTTLKCLPEMTLFWYFYCQLTTYFAPLSGISNVVFEQVNIYWDM